MKKHHLSGSLKLMLLFLIFTSCGKGPEAEPDTTGGIPGGGTAAASGSLASFKKIPLPTVNLNNLIIPNLADFHVTNQGAYVQIQDSKKMMWSVHKYHLSSGGTPEWSSFTPTFKAMHYYPTKTDTEKDREFSIYWSHTDLPDDKYGMYNLNNGTPSFEYKVPDNQYGPGRINKIIPSKRGFHRNWFISGNDIWVETAVAVPKTLQEIPTLGIKGNLRVFYADPDDETELWCASENNLYQVGSVGSGPGTSAGILKEWTIGSGQVGDMIQAIIKVNKVMIVQAGNKVYKLDAGVFKQIGALSVSGGVVSNIATNGTTIYASDGTYFKSSTNTWESFIGDGKNLSSADAAKYAELKSICSTGGPIGVVSGSVNGSVFLLTPTDLVQISPTF